MMETITFQPTAEDVVAASRLNFLVSIGSKRVARNFLCGGIGFSTIMALMAGLGFFDSVPTAAAIGLAYWICLFALILGLTYIRLPARVRRVFKQQKSLHDMTTINWSDDGIDFVSQRGHFHYAWSDYIQIVRGKDAVILRQSEALFNFIPTRILSPAQLDSLPLSV